MSMSSPDKEMNEEREKSLHIVSQFCKLVKFSQMILLIFTSFCTVIQARSEGFTTGGGGGGGGGGRGKS